MAKKKGKKKPSKSKAVKEKSTESAEDLAKKDFANEEQKEISSCDERLEDKPLKFKNLESDSGGPNIAPIDADAPFWLAKLARALGTSDRELQSYLLAQAAETFAGLASADGYNNDKITGKFNYACAILHGIKPQDELEGMLAVQMIGVHNMAMETLKRAMLGGQSFEGKDVNINQATKMLRTFMAQMETLKKYRTGGQQKMIVEHVHVNEGGQAIVGTVNQGGGKNDKNRE